MNFDLTDEQQMLQAAARDFLASRLTSEKLRALAETDDAFSEDLWKEISDLGWPGLMVRADNGGQELGTIELAVLFEQLGYALTPGPVLSDTLAAIALDEAIPRVRVVRPGDRSVLREVVDPDDLVAALQELLYEIAADEAGGTAHDDRAHVILGPNA